MTKKNHFPHPLPLAFVKSYFEFSLPDSIFLRIELSSIRQTLEKHKFLGIVGIKLRDKAIW